MILSADDSIDICSCPIRFICLHDAHLIFGRVFDQLICYWVMGNGCLLTPHGLQVQGTGHGSHRRSECPCALYRRPQAGI